MVISLTNASGLIRLAHHPSHRRGIQSFGPKFPLDSSLNGRVSYKSTVNGYPKMSVCFARQSPPSFHEEPEPPSLWLSLARDIVGSTRSVFSFMAEQPSQLRFIEWPSFTATLKTATLSLLLVAVFIVALSSVDSALCYVLALILRKSL
ncbi:Transmembrane protein [Hirschfeldia incana]|nr:Transmembrane protein [Hirschfeldia incana]